MQSCQPPTEGKLAKHEIAQHKVMRKLISSIVGVSHNAQVDNESTQMGSTHREWRWGGIKNNNSDRQNINSGETDGVLLPLAQGFEAVGSVRKLTSDR